MACDLTLSTGEVLLFHEVLSPAYQGPWFEGARIVSCNNNQLQLFQQEILTDAYSIRLTEGTSQERVTTIGRLQYPGLYAYFMLRNSLRKEISSLGRFHLREDQYSCLFLQPVTVKYILEGEKPFRLLDIFYSSLLLEEFSPYFPGLKKIMLAGKQAVIPDAQCWMNARLSEVLHHLIHSPFDTATRAFYFDLKVREILYHILEQGFRKQYSLSRFTPWEIARIHEARTILKSHIGKRPPTLKQLARMVALNEFKLKKGFRQYFHCGMFQWLHAEKMKYSRELILNTDKQIKEISMDVGYPRSSNFIHAFRAYFGHTPASLRRE